MFSGKRVTVLASFHSDGIHRSVLMEPNCGQLDGTSKTPPPSEPQCARGVAPNFSDKLEDDPNYVSLKRALMQGDRSTMDKHITAAYTGILRCEPSCRSPQRLALKIERVENVQVLMKDMRPHRPE
jgi:hypothetical protein